MAVRLSSSERYLLGEMEAVLRTTDPALDRLLGRRRNAVIRLAWRPLPLVVWVATTAVVTAGCLLCAGAYSAAAAVPAVLGAAGTVWGFRRLARLDRG
ncbi:DUF3040 domain-containing protein [Kitasatospora sp. NPDC049285]|uniref:DUF3040 domain-containing protein n=1 Tax=Kitasatospora sp. NPDC049285 TaxID=3157096 RepID=UPI00342615DA